MLPAGQHMQSVTQSDRHNSDDITHTPYVIRHHLIISWAALGEELGINATADLKLSQT